MEGRHGGAPFVVRPTRLSWAAGMGALEDQAGPRSGSSDPRQRWRLGFGELTWRLEDRAYADVLEALTRERQALLRQGQELATPAHAPAAEAIDGELERGARAELAVFRAALEDARRRAGPDGRAEVPYDSRDPAQDSWAEVLIQYLVRPGYAEVRTEEPEPWHYRYWIRVDWDAVRRLAAGEGQRLPL
jgi:hypothetical protein